MPPKESVSHIRFPIRVRVNDTHVYIQDAVDRTFGTVSYSKRVPFSLDYAKLVCTAQARALTETFQGKPPDDLTFKIELWFDDGSNIQQTLALSKLVANSKCGWCGQGGACCVALKQKSSYFHHTLQFSMHYVQAVTALHKA